MKLLSDTIDEMHLIDDSISFKDSIVPTQQQGPFSLRKRSPNS
ncbi:hypothetical protein N8585_01425 [bacterium]|nr:hypothetical protein [bacterium]